ncbi:hypothetical protein B0H65DRAFT_564921 [Neurospora tetraspora]|uniref:Uncharacterized protein n=1 Tax=Neurospora tetraspora TaxID=94610 RepID=A0AAE0MWV7_9PEZI|nr:hypothetical protein B0H65DRAFT_564921 [Neurospora tetraspora]
MPAGPGRGSGGTALGTVVHWPTITVPLLCANLMPKRLPPSWSKHRPIDDSIITPSFSYYLFMMLSRTSFEAAPAPRSHVSAAHSLVQVRIYQPKATVRSLSTLQLFTSSIISSWALVISYGYPTKLALRGAVPSSHSLSNRTTTFYVSIELFKGATRVPLTVFIGAFNVISPSSLALASTDSVPSSVPSTVLPGLDRSPPGVLHDPWRWLAHGTDIVPAESGKGRLN